MNKKLSLRAVEKTVLSNGLTVLVYPRHVVPKVSLQLWYNVGSKDEMDGERGLAHLIEHMIFKGTEKLSESDANFITHKLSGYCNAFTSYDYTTYLFDFPKKSWEYGAFMLADWMRNCTFKQDLLNSEFKAVIQELKMYRDDYSSSLSDAMIAQMFPDHPYHHPIIGYKKDLIDVTADRLLAFYHKHYVPNNATLVVTGDVTAQEVFATVEKFFGTIPADLTHKKRDNNFQQDIVARSVTLYRDVQQEQYMLAFVIPGFRRHEQYLFDSFNWVLGAGRGSRLYKKLVDELCIATDIDSFIYSFFEHSIFFIDIQPKEGVSLQEIAARVQEQIDLIVEHGLTDLERQRATHQMKAGFYGLLQSNHNVASFIGESYLATGDAQYLSSYWDHADNFEPRMRELARAYFRSSVMQSGQVLPIPEREKKYWMELQQQEDELDEQFLGSRVRVSEIEDPVLAHTITAPEPAPFTFPRYQKEQLENGLTVISGYNADVPMVSFCLNVEADQAYDPEGKSGVHALLSRMLLEGTARYTGPQLVEEIESRGMSLSCEPGAINLVVLKEDTAIGLQILHEIVAHATLPEASFEKIKEQQLADLDEYWDDPATFVQELGSKYVYQNHQYSKPVLGDPEDVEQLEHKDLVEIYRKHMTPHRAKLAVVGDYPENIAALISNTLGAWRGPQIALLQYPEIKPVKKAVVDFPAQRNQVVLAFVGKSVTRMHPQYDALVLLEQIVTGGVLGSMSARLFQLREQTGWFYSIGGSLVSDSAEEPGMIDIKTMVSIENMEDAQAAIEHELTRVTYDITEQELQDAKNALIYSLVDYAGSNSRLATAFLFCERFGLSIEYFDKRAESLKKVTVKDVQQAARDWLDVNKLALIRVGRLDA